jgi:hypothetical protein
MVPGIHPNQSFDRIFFGELSATIIVIIGTAPDRAGRGKSKGASNE